MSIYVASRASIAERGAMWRQFRSSGIPIVSSWIDEDGEGQTQSFSDLLLMGNPFAFCDTHQFSLRSAPDRIGPDNDLWLMRMRDYAGMHLAAWGNNAEIDLERIAVVRAMFPQLYTLGFTQNGHPKHPLRLAKTLKPILWEEAKAA